MKQWCAMAFFSLFVAQVAAADSIESGFIVGIEDREIYINLSQKNGLEPGARIRIKRPIRLKHPVTRAVISDWLPIGPARITAVGQSLAMAVLEPDLLSQVVVGDVVEVLVLSSEPALAAPAPRPAQAPLPIVPDRTLPAVDEHTAAVLEVWQAMAGQKVEARIGAWESFLTEHPESSYAAVVRSDIEILRAIRNELRPTELTMDRVYLGRLIHDPPTRARPGETIGLAFLIDSPDLAAAWVHYRIRGSSSYSKAILRRDSDHYLRGEIPASAVIGPGIEYFVEIATSRGDVGASVGSPHQPVFIDVPSPPLRSAFTAKRRRSRVSITATYLDFATFDDRGDDRTDMFYLFEADFLYRLHKVLYGVRVGMGALNGKGGFAEAIYNNGRSAPEAGFNYGYTEFELRGRYHTAISARLVAGVGREGFGLGLEGRFRLGPEDGTNLTLGASNVQQIGYLTEIRMQWDALTSFPIGLAVALTDRPNRGDLGVRLTTDLGYRALSWVQPTLRISYQARTVVHAGIGAGVGLVFDW